MSGTATGRREPGSLIGWEIQDEAFHRTLDFANSAKDLDSLSGDRGELRGAEHDPSAAPEKPTGPVERPRPRSDFAGSASPALTNDDPPSAVRSMAIGIPPTEPKETLIAENLGAPSVKGKAYPDGPAEWSSRLYSHSMVAGGLLVTS